VAGCKRPTRQIRTHKAVCAIYVPV
jgi:hypothetical protein